ncbi:hypothetical protein K7432_013505 [Basidiobolus ranarum]|uniref:Uncharacterized protein n=1 Tax=Basidiobolus ranarum TaxID=34480 RepID=A0ABR2WJ37_9FUNG
MRFTIVLAAIASLSVMVSAQDKGSDHPTSTNTTKPDYDLSGAYPIPSNPTCIADCNNKAGSDMMPGYTSDPSKKEFIDSLALECSQGPRRLTFMKNAGMCMGSCSKEDQDQYLNNYGPMCDWYKLHVDDVKPNDATSFTAATTMTAMISLVVFNFIA